MLDEKYDYYRVPQCEPDIEGLVTSLRGGESDGIGRFLFNRFEEVVLPMRPLANALKAELSRLGAFASMMSGSGPSVFGLFEDGKVATDACSELQARGIPAFMCKFN